ncbi:hypothetical protein AX14_002592 [Amanita brunnescens Koide BX004]|nr:hypothetical protein AX14_002592 [Amanita brunnescens Koide BX004]
MCEEQPAVKALAFLQNDVANVVNHSDTKESEEFRSLMKHLLAPPAYLGLSSRTSSTSTLRAGSAAVFRSLTSDAKTESKKSHDSYNRDPRATELQNRKDRKDRIFELDEEREEDEDEGDEDNAEQEQESGSEDEDDCGWTNDISNFGKNVERDDSDGSMIEDAGITLFVNPDALLDVPDATEFRSRGKRAESATEGQEIPSGLRYQQRTQVFEALLGYIGEEDKQPSGSLLDLVGERGGGGMMTDLNITAVEPLWL